MPSFSYSADCDGGTIDATTKFLPADSESTAKPKSARRSTARLEMDEKEELGGEAAKETAVQDGEALTPETRRSVVRKTIIAIVVVIVVAVTWATSTQMTTSALLWNPKKFNPPFFLMWFGTNFMIACLPVYLVFAKYHEKRPTSESINDSLDVLRGPGGLAISTLYRVFPFLVLWTGANFAYSSALTYITPSTATTISSCNTAMVYLLAIALLGDRFHIFKLLSVACAIGGVALISVDGEMNSHWKGLVLSVVSALCAALYKVLFKRIIGDASLGQVSMFMSTLGLLNLFVNAIPTIILASTKSEDLDLHHVPWGYLVAGAVLSLLFNFAVNFGIALLHPLVISIGMLTGIPLNTAIDVVFRDLHITWKYGAGASFIMLSVVFIVFPWEILAGQMRRRTTTAVGEKR